MQCARAWKVEGEFTKLRESALRAHRSHFNRFISARNTHTHEADVRYAELSRVSLIDLLTLGKEFRVLSTVAPKAFKGAKRRLLNDVDEVIREAGKLLRLVLRGTRPVWSQL